MPTSAPKPKRHDLFYWKNHQRADADIHEPILEEGDHKKAEIIGRKIAERLGLTKEQCDSLFGNEKKAFDPSEPRDETGK